jgi:hypothetical protein
VHLQLFPGLILFDVNQSIVDCPRGGDDDVAVLQIHLRCRIGVGDSSNRALGIPFGVRDPNVGRCLLMEERSVDR